MEKFEVLSPDGFTIELHRPYYNTIEEAFQSFDNWKKRYELQGYYSSVNYGKISLDELEEYITVRKI